MMQNLLVHLKINSYCFVLFLVISTTASWAQKIDLAKDLILIDSIAKQTLPNKSKKPYIYKNQSKTFCNSNPVSLIYGGSLYLYQNYFTQHFSASCLYHPSCSEFSKHAVKEYGLLKGTLLSFDRLSRCNRIAATDLHLNEIDPKTHRFHDPAINYK